MFNCMFQVQFPLPSSSRSKENILFLQYFYFLRLWWSQLKDQIHHTEKTPNKGLLQLWENGSNKILFQKFLICHFFRTGHIRTFWPTFDRNRYFSSLIVAKLVSNDDFKDFLVALSSTSAILIYFYTYFLRIVIRMRPHYEGLLESSLFVVLQFWVK